MKFIFKILGSLFLLSIIAFGSLISWKLYPHDEPKELPTPLFSADSEQGKNLLKDSYFSLDYAQLSTTFQSQSLVSYCGVATSVSVLNALGIKVNQSNFFTSSAAKIRSQIKVMFGGMSLADLAGLLMTYGVTTSIHYADESSVEQFRQTIEKNLATAGDYLIVNYQRDTIGQEGFGHISPLAAYDKNLDSVLIMDTAAHRYPQTWVPVELLYQAMQTIDPSTGKMRGYLVVSK